MCQTQRLSALCIILCATAPILDARQPLRARHGMVVARERHATDVGEAVLESGGNAVDAAVAVGLTLAVTHPAAGNLGGGGFMLIRFADGRSTFVDFRERGPGSASRDMYLDPEGKPTKDSLIGYRASGVPGTVKGLEYAHRKWGRKPWKELVNPAVDLAAKGFPVSWGLATSLQSEIVSEKLAPFENSKRIFLKGGTFYQPGDLLIQPELAATLKRIRDKGSKDFYEGETARLLAADMKAHGGLITVDDLQAYKAIERQPLLGKYRGYDIITAPPPSSGGIGVLQMLGVLEGTDYYKGGAGSAAELHMLAETMRRYFADRSEYLGDPDFYKVPVSTLLNPKYIATLRESIDPAKATPSEQVKPGSLTAYESMETTHFSIVDAEGNAVAVTYTLNSGFGSGVTVSKLGFLLNNEMDDFAPKPGEPNAYGLIQGEANAIAPHKTPLSSMVPTIVAKDGKLFLVVGSPGGPTIINSVLQTILNTIDFHMNAQEAVDQPRIHHQWMPDVIVLEQSFSPDTMDLLRAKGHQLRPVPTFGEVAAILFDGEWLQGAPDGRVEATAKGY
ncbi:MAG: gamma-glutamyltransferase [Bryobacterales bacterium]|nr:gamma-glutamyltransferase [Bryobacterales bacterium]